MNKLLTETIAKIESSVPPQFKQAVDRIVTGGRKLMWSEPTYPEVKTYVQGIQGPQDVTAKVSHGIVKAISLIAKDFKVPPDLKNKFYPAAFPAGQILMCDVLAYVEKAKQIPATPELIASTTQAVNQGLIKLFGITPEMAKAAIQKAQEKAGGTGMMDRAAPPSGAPPAPQPPSAPAAPPQGV